MVISPLADGKNKLTEADFAVLESMVVAQEAEMEEMAFKIEAEANQARVELEGSQMTKSDVSVDKGTKKQIQSDSPVRVKVKRPVQSSISTPIAKPESMNTNTDTGQHPGGPAKCVTDAASMVSPQENVAPAAEGSEVSHVSSSDEGEEQMMIMRDSPRWEDEEIQAENDEPRTIKAEIKLLVKTTEVGKESIEIRSIREFVEHENANLAASEGAVQSPVVESTNQLTPGGGVHHLQKASSDLHSPSPKFTRPQVASTYSSYCEPSQDDFDLMAQVRGKAGF